MMLTSIRVLGSQAPGVPHYAQRRLAVVHAQRDFMGEKRTGIVSSFATLESWQLRKLKAAFFQGRRNVSIKQLAAEVELDRDDVLAFMKEYAETPAKQLEAEREALDAEREAAAARRAAAQSDRAASGSSSKSEELGSSKRMTFAELKAAGLIGRRRITGEVERTLESIFEKSAWPSDEVISGLWDLHKVSRRDAIAWFSARREREGQWVREARGEARGAARGDMGRGRGRGRGQDAREGRAEDDEGWFAGPREAVGRGPAARRGRGSGADSDAARPFTAGAGVLRDWEDDEAWQTSLD